MSHGGVRPPQCLEFYNIYNRWRLSPVSQCMEVKGYDCGFVDLQATLGRWFLWVGGLPTGSAVRLLWGYPRPCTQLLHLTGAPRAAGSGVLE